MEANELRIGNYAIYAGGIVKMTVPEFSHFLRFPKMYKGLELTEDWLLLLGFNKEYKKGYIGKDVCNTDFVLTYPLKMGEWQNHFALQFETGNVPKFKQIGSVHQLQNLYFALTGEELSEE